MTSPRKAILELTHLVLWAFPPIREQREVWGFSFHPAPLRVGGKGPIHSSLPLSARPQVQPIGNLPSITAMGPGAGFSRDPGKNTNPPETRG